MSKGKLDKAYRSMARMRNSPLQAARDTFFAYELLQAEEEIIQQKKNRLLEMVTVPRNRKGLMGSGLVM